MSSNESLEKLADIAQGLGLKIRFCHAGVLVVCTPDNAKETIQNHNKPSDGVDGEKGRNVREGEGESQAS